MSTEFTYVQFSRTAEDSQEEFVTDESVRGFTRFLVSHSIPGLVAPETMIFGIDFRGEVDYSDLYVEYGHRDHEEVMKRFLEGEAA